MAGSACSMPSTSIDADPRVGGLQLAQALDRGDPAIGLGVGGHDPGQHRARPRAGRPCPGPGRPRRGRAARRRPPPRAGRRAASGRPSSPRVRQITARVATAPCPAPSLAARTRHGLVLLLLVVVAARGGELRVGEVADVRVVALADRCEEAGRGRADELRRSRRPPGPRRGRGRPRRHAQDSARCPDSFHGDASLASRRARRREPATAPAALATAGGRHDSPTARTRATATARRGASWPWRRRGGYAGPPMSWRRRDAAADPRGGITT